MADLRIGIVGIGNMGSAHFNYVNSGKIEGMTLSAVCDLRQERLDYCKENAPGVRCYTDWQELVKDSNIDAIIIAVPHPLHADIAMAALTAGKHVLTEKPVDVRISKAKALNECAAKSGKVFGIVFNQRTNPLFQKAREIVHSGALGELNRTVWIITNWYRTQAYYDSGSWRATWSGEGGGVLLNQCPHQLDLWQWICGMPVAVSGFCNIAKYHNIEVEDDVTIVTRYENGATGTFITSTGEWPGTNRLEITGTLGKLVLEEGKLKWWKLDRDVQEHCINAGQDEPKPGVEYSEYVPDAPTTGHPGILQNFSNAIRFGEPLLAPGTEGIKELTISNAAYLSAWNGSCVIELPLDTEAFDRKMDELATASNLRQNAVSDKVSTGYNARWQVQW